MCLFLECFFTLNIIIQPEYFPQKTLKDVKRADIAVGSFQRKRKNVQTCQTYLALFDTRLLPSEV